jgi:HEAT repeat protein
MPSLKAGRLLGFFRSDRAPILLLGALHWVLSGAHTLADVGATSLLVGHLGPDVLPQVYLAEAVLLGAAGLFVIPLIDRLDRRWFFRASLLVFAALIGMAHHQGDHAPGLLYRGLYLVTGLMQSLLFLQFWLIAGDICDLRQAKRVFPLLLGFGLAGGLSGSLAASVLPRFLPTEEMLLVSAILLLLGLLPLGWVSRHFRERLVRPRLPYRVRAASIPSRLKADFKVSTSTPLLRTLSPCLLLFALLAQVLDYLMGTAAAHHFRSPAGTATAESLAGFYAGLNGAVIGTGAIVQFFMASRFFSSVGITRGLVLAPAVFLGGFAAIGATLGLTAESLGPAFFFTVLGTRALQRVLRISVYRSSVDLLYNPVPVERRGRAKAFKDTFLEPAGTFLGGLMLLAGGWLSLRAVVLAALALSGVFLYLTIKLKAFYLGSLVDLLREKSRFRFAFPSSVAARLPERRRVVTDLERAIGNDEASVRLLAVEVAAELGEPATAPLLVRRFRQEPDPRVRATMVIALGRLLKRRLGSLVALEPSLEDADPRVRANGIEALAQIGLTESAVFLPPFTRDAEPRIRANAAVALSRLDPEEGQQTSFEILSSMYRSGAEAPQRSALYGLGQMGDRNAVDLLGTIVGGKARSVLRRQAVLGLARTGEREAVEKLVEAVEQGDGATRHLAARALASCGERAVDPLLLALWRSDVEARRYVAQALSQLGSHRAQQALVHVLSLEAEEAYYDLLRLGKLAALPQTEGVFLLADALARRVAQAKRNALEVLRSVFGDQKGMRLILCNLTHPDPHLRSSAIEALESTVDPALLTGLLPLFEHSDPRVTLEHGGSFFHLPDKKPLEVLIELTRHPSGWLRACAFFALGQVGGNDALGVLERGVQDSYELARLNAIEAVGRRGVAESLSLLERVGEQRSEKLNLYLTEAQNRIRLRTARPSD